MLRPDGNGGFNISKTSTVSMGLVLIIIGMCVGLAVAWGSQVQALDDHIDNGNIHWCKDALDDAYVPRGELQAELRHINASLQRIEKKVDKHMP